MAKYLIFQLPEKGYVVRGSVSSLESEGELFTDLIMSGLPEKTFTHSLSCMALNLENDEGWDAALTGIDTLMHTDSPFYLDAPKDEETLIRPAVDGTKRALVAAQNAGVNRVILTSSTVTIVSYPQKLGGATFDDSDWANLKASAAYGKSKILAERPTWDFVATDAPEIALTTINPDLVLGQPIRQRLGASLAVVKRILSGKDPMIPNIGFSCINVRNIATAHIATIERPKTAGERFACSSEYLKLAELAVIIKTQYPNRKIATRVAPNLLMHFLGIFDPAIRGIVSALAQRAEVDNKKRRRSSSILNFAMYPKAC